MRRNSVLITAHCGICHIEGAVHIHNAGIPHMPGIIPFVITGYNGVPVKRVHFGVPEEFVRGIIQAVHLPRTLQTAGAGGKNRISARITRIYRSSVVFLRICPCKEPHAVGVAALDILLLYIYYLRLIHAVKICKQVFARTDPPVGFVKTHGAVRRNGKRRIIAGNVIVRITHSRRKARAGNRDY